MGARADLLPVPVDKNQNALVTSGRETFTYTWASVGTGGQAISATIDVKGCMILTDATEFKMTGTATGSAEVTVEASGIDDMRVSVPANTTICTIAAVSGTIAVTLVAWR